MVLAMALTAAPMVLSAAPGMAVAVDKLPLSMPAPLNHAELDHPEYCEAGLLPYPFGSTSNYAGGTSQGKFERLVSIVGLHRANVHRASAGQLGSAASCEVAPATLNQVSLPAMHLHAVPSQVVSASGTQFIGTGSGESIVPALPILAQHSSLPAAAPALEESDELSQSLIDIAIPLDMMLSSQASAGTAMPLESPSLESPSLKSPALELPSLEMSTAATLPAPPNVAAAVPDRKPELIQPAKSLSLTTRQPSSQSVNLSLKDTPTATLPAAGSAEAAYAVGSPASATSTSAQTYALSDATLDDIPRSERGVALHLSSASQSPMKAAAAATDMGKSQAPQFPQRGSAMQVRIEGEPAPMFTGHQAGGLGRMAPAAPMPSMAGLSHQATPVGAELYESSNKVKAAFATRTSIIADRDLGRSLNTLGRGAKQPGESLTIGLQESQSLSAQFVITELSVEHPSICQLMQTGESSVSLVGIRPGSTRIALVMVNDSGERQVEIHEVSVTTASAAAQSLPDLAAELSRAVGRLVPNSDVEIVAYEDYILVHGFTHYESDAKKILSLVRKTSLVPVVDQLKSNDQ